MKQVAPHLVRIYVVFFLQQLVQWCGYVFEAVNETSIQILESGEASQFCFICRRLFLQIFDVKLVHFLCSWFAELTEVFNAVAEASTVPDVKAYYRFCQGVKVLINVKDMLLFRF